MFLDIFLDILHKSKGNLGEEHVKRMLYPSRAKIGTIFSAIPGKMTAFQFCPYCSIRPSLKSGFSTLAKIIFLRKGNNRAIL